MNIEQKLATGSHLVAFTKKDGTLTQRKVTLDPTLYPVFEAKTDRITKQSPETIRVFDLDKGSFISLIRKNIISF